MGKTNKDKNNKSSYIFTKETLGMTLMLFSAVVLLMLLTHSAVFWSIGSAVCTFMYGTFGYGCYFVIALLAYLGEWLVFEKKIKIRVKSALVIALTALCVFLLFHAVSSRNIPLTGYGSYISGCYTAASQGFSGYTFGGVISALIVYPVAKLTTFTGAYIIFSLLTVLCGYLIFLTFFRGKISKANSRSTVQTDGGKKERAGGKIKNEQPAEQPVAQQAAADNLYAINDRLEIVSNAGRANEAQTARQTPEQPEPKADDPYSPANLGRKILFENGEFAAESYRRNMIFSESSYFNHPVHNDSDYLSNFSDARGGGKNNAVPEQSYTESYEDDVLNRPASSAPVNYVYGDKPVDNLGLDDDVSGNSYSVQEQEKYSRYDESANDYSDALNANASDMPREDYYKPEDKYREEITPAEPPAPQASAFNTAERNGVEQRRESSPYEEKPEEPSNAPESGESGADSVNMFNIFGSSSVSRGDSYVEPDVSRLSSRRTEKRSNADLFDADDDGQDEILSAFGQSPSLNADRTDKPVSERNRGVAESRNSANNAQRAQEPAAPEPAKDEKPKHVWKKYVRPSLDLLDDRPESNNVNTGEIEENKRMIVETLARFKIECEVSNVTIGPAITRYDIIIEDKTKIKQSLNYKEAIAMALMKENVNAYLNYSKGALSIEVPNNKRAVVGLKTMLVSSKFINCKPNSVTFALGKNVEGEVVCPDITKMPHLLVAGTTGSGKSICLSSLIISLLYKYGPEELRFILVDPKQVEFISYDKLPHLMINEIIYEVDKAIKALNWAIKEMERRYSLFKEMTEHGIATKNLDEYNSHLQDGEEKLPKIVIILDEFGDLMLQAKKDIEGRIIKLVQKARACGIHLILATQRPSVDCITGLIKSNLPTRIGFKVNSFDDSRTIFDIGGAEKLLGMGDMYFRSAESPELARIQGCFVDSHEVQKVTDFIKAHNETYFDQDVSDFINKVEEENTASSGGGDEGVAEGDTKIDDTFIKALKYCVTSNQASVSMIQRRFPVGYIKACKIIDWMENMNYITQPEGSKPRKVLLSKEEFFNTYGDIDD